MSAGDIPFGGALTTPWHRLGPVPTNALPKLPDGYTGCVPVDYGELIRALEHRVAQLEERMAQMGLE